MDDAEFNELRKYMPIVGSMVGLGKLVLDGVEQRELADIVTRSTAEEQAFVDGSCRYVAPISLERKETRSSVESIGIVLSANRVMLAYRKPGKGNTVYTVQIADIKEYHRKDSLEQAA